MGGASGARALVNAFVSALVLAPTPQGTMRESGLAQTRGTLDTLPDHKNVLRAWGLQFLAA